MSTEQLFRSQSAPSNLGRIRPAARFVALILAGALGGGAVTLALPTPAFAATPGILGSGETLTAGQSVTSVNNAFKLIMQSDGNLVLYACSVNALRNSHTVGNAGARVVMQTDGNLVVYSSANVALWNSHTAGNPGAYLAVQSDGHLVLYSTAKSVLWVSGPIAAYAPLCPGRALQSSQSLLSTNQKFRLVMQSDGNLVLYDQANVALWNTGTAGHAGAYVIMQGDGNLVVYYNATALWNSGTAGHSGAFLEVQNSGTLAVYLRTSEFWPVRTVATPSWWSGTCDVGYNSTFKKIGSWNGLIGCGPGGLFRYESESGSPLSYNWEWQCVELSERWLYQEYHIPQQSLAGGKDVASTYWNNYISTHPAVHLRLVSPSTAGPGKFAAGDVISYTGGSGTQCGGGPCGHTNVVVSVTISNASTGAGTYTSLNENGASGGTVGITQGNIVGWVPQALFSGESIKNWLDQTVG